MAALLDECVTYVEKLKAAILQQEEETVRLCFPVLVAHPHSQTSLISPSAWFEYHMIRVGKAERRPGYQSAFIFPSIQPQLSLDASSPQCRIHGWSAFYLHPMQNTPYP